MRIPFVHLTIKSSFSLLEGMIAPKKLAKVLSERGEAACGVAELGNIFSAVEVSKHVGGAGVQPVLGCEIRISGLRDSGVLGKEACGTLGTVVLLAQDGEGWKNLCRLVSTANFAKGAGRDEAVTLDELLAQSGGLICLSGGLMHGMGYTLNGERGAANGLEVLRRLAGAFAGRFYIQLERYGWRDDKVAARMREGEARLLAFARAEKLPLVATHDVRFLKRSQREACEALLCIADGTVLDDPKRRKLSDDMYLKTADEMVTLFADLPSALANSVEIARRCAFKLDAVNVKAMYMPVYTAPDGSAVDVNEEIRKQAAEGLVQRLEDFVYPLCADEEAKAAAKVRYEEQLAYELKVIIDMGFPGYFLITSDFIRWAKGQGIPVGPGRGSGAGSLVAWSLEITDLDPIRWGLYFERFLNPDRVSLPDFDIDFCQDRRGEVIDYVQGRFGADRVSQIITFGTLKAKACLRDVGRVLGMGYSEVGQIAAFVPEGINPETQKAVTIAETLEADERLRERYDSDERVQVLVDMAMQLEGCYRHASTHAAGVIITDRRIDEVCGLYVDPRSGMPATQFSMNDAEYAGLVKFDFLGLKTLSVIKMGCEMVWERHGARGAGHGEGAGAPWLGAEGRIEILKIPLDDQPTFDEVKKGHTVGIFQIESAGMTELTKRMKADDLEALSALVALYRPGPLGTGMVDDYINCRLGKKAPEYPHPVLVDALKDSFGVPVYQEQIMRMARDLAGYTLGGADMLRRAMGKKKPEEMAKERAKFVKGAETEHGVVEADANRIFDLMETFAGYGFNKAHSLAYALISYQTAWLKAHHPLEFMAATMTYDRGNTDRLLRYKQDLERMGAKLLTADVNASGVYFTVDGERGTENGGAVRHALAALKGTGEEAMRRVVAERVANGLYKDIWDFCARLGAEVLNKKQIDVLAKGGALDGVAKAAGLSRADVVNNVEVFVAYAVASTEEKTSGQNSLFGGSDGSVDAAPYKHSIRKEMVDAMVVLGWEQEVVGFYLSDHPLSGFVPELKQLFGYKQLPAIEDFAARGGGMAKVAGVVLGIREVKTKAGNRMGIVSLSDPFGAGEVVVFPEAYEQVGETLRSGEPLLFTVQVKQDGERIRVASEEVRPLKTVLAAREEVEIVIPEPAMLAQVQALLDKAGQGRTRVQLRMKTPQGEAVVKLPRGVTYSPALAAGLRQVVG